MCTESLGWTPQPRTSCTVLRYTIHCRLNAAIDILCSNILYVHCTTCTLVHGTLYAGSDTAVNTLYSSTLYIVYTIHSGLLNAYTVQNPRQHVIIKKNSQMRTICTQIGRNLSVYLSLWVSFFPGGDTFLYLGFFIPQKYGFNIHELQIYRNKPPQRMLRLPMASDTGNYYTQLARFL